MSPLFQYHQVAPFPDSSISIMNLDWHLQLFKELLVISIYMLLIWWILRESPISTFYTSGQLTIIVNEKEQKHLVFCTRENRKLQVLSNKFRDSNMLEHLIEQYHTRAFIYSFFLRKFGGRIFLPPPQMGATALHYAPFASFHLLLLPLSFITMMILWAQPLELA
jgi:hypothetical protein